MDAQKYFDVVVVGGGIVGGVQALLFARRGLSVLLVEAATQLQRPVERPVDQPDAQPDEQPLPLQQRSVALSYRSFELLASEDLWPADKVCPIREIQVTNRGYFGATRISCDDLNTDALGYAVANHDLESHLHHLLRLQDNVEFVQPATARLIQNSSAGAELQVSYAPGASSGAGSATGRSATELPVRCGLLLSLIHI